MKANTPKKKVVKFPTKAPAQPLAPRSSSPMEAPVMPPRVGLPLAPTPDPQMMQ